MIAFAVGCALLALLVARAALQRADKLQRDMMALRELCDGRSSCADMAINRLHDRLQGVERVRDDGR